MPNMIQSLGRDYFNQFFQGSIVKIDDRVLQVRGAQGNAGRTVLCVDMENGQGVEIPADRFTGWKSFEYPILGYRRFGEHHLAYSTKLQSVHRGLKIANVQTTWTAATRLLIDLGAISGARLTEEQKAVALFKPVFDSLADVPALLDGRKTGLVLSPNLIIEPSTEKGNEWYAVHYKQAVIGSVSDRGVVRFKSPQHASILPANLL